MAGLELVAQESSTVTQGCNMPSFSKPVVRILVVGLTGHGKSSLINKMVGEDVAPVAHGAEACQHEKYIMLYEQSFNGTMLHIYDTQGLGDISISAETIFQSIRHELKQVDLILICHRLYDRAEEATQRMLQRLALQCGKELLNRSILCYTRADEHLVNRHNPIENQKDSLTLAIKNIFMKQCVMTRKEFDAIPICLTSIYEQELPTAPNWQGTFWECCVQRSSKDAKGFLSLFARHKLKMMAVGGGSAGAVVGGVTLGTAVGAVVGTGLIPIPGVGTAVGTVVGSIIGGVFVGGTVGGASGAGVKVGTDKVRKKKGKKEDRIPLLESEN